MNDPLLSKQAIVCIRNGTWIPVRSYRPTKSEMKRGVSLIREYRASQGKIFIVTWKSGIVHTVVKIQTYRGKPAGPYLSRDVISS